MMSESINARALLARITANPEKGTNQQNPTFTYEGYHAFEQLLENMLTRIETLESERDGR